MYISHVMVFVHSGTASADNR